MPSYLEEPWPEHADHVTSETGWATKTTNLQLVAALYDVLNPSKEGQACILLWDIASIHASEATMTAKAARRAVLHPAAQHFVLAALRRGRLPQRQELHPDAGDHDTGPLRHRRIVRRRGHEQGMATTVTS